MCREFEPKLPARFRSMSAIAVAAIYKWEQKMQAGVGRQNQC